MATTIKQITHYLSNRNWKYLVDENNSAIFTGVIPNPPILHPVSLKPSFPSALCLLPSASCLLSSAFCLQATNSVLQLDQNRCS